MSRVKQTLTPVPFWQENILENKEDVFHQNIATDTANGQVWCKLYKFRDKTITAQVGEMEPVPITSLILPPVKEEWKDRRLDYVAEKDSICWNPKGTLLLGRDILCKNFNLRMVKEWYNDVDVCLEARSPTPPPQSLSQKVIKMGMSLFGYCNNGSEKDD